MAQDDTAHATLVGLFADEKVALQACEERNIGLNSVMGWALVGPQGQMGVALGQILASFGIKGVKFDVMSAEPQGAILTPDKKIVLPH